ncbi:MAG: chromosome segregation protein SMC [Rhodothalassiaceae bacterium]
MQFTRLRLSGFKSFVDPTELRIEKGLTGIVGPNGCGKSNLVEALRWVMGESSARSMRGAGMDDVIFSGTDRRPARTLAEVSLLIENDDRRAGAAFNDADMIEVTRRIERESGSAYRINGQDVRARDVQLLFADSATGAHSPALVSQGRVGALVTARPQDRRAILEEAAGISGLHSRRREAEQRLRAAEANLLRLQDVIVQLETQIASLRKQARQAARWRAVAGHIREAEAILLYLKWKTAVAEATAFEERLRATDLAVAEAAGESARLDGEQAERAATLQDLRKAEAEAAAALQRHEIARETLEAEERRRIETLSRLERSLEEIARDKLRETESRDDSHAAREQLEAERARLLAAAARDEEVASEAAERLAEATRAASEAESVYDALSARLSEARGRRASLSSDIAALERRRDRILRERAETRDALARLAAEDEGGASLDGAEEAVAEAEAALEAGEARLAAAREAVHVRREARDRARETLATCESAARALSAEISAIEKRLAGKGDGQGRAIAERVRVTPGLERALGAALGETLEASEDESDRICWRLLPDYEEAKVLPSGLLPLSDFVTAPPVLARRLAHVGLAEEGADPAALQAALMPGQCIVDRAGALWRWDGLKVAADAPSLATLRLEQKNRLDALQDERSRMQLALDEARASLDEASAALHASEKDEQAHRETQRGRERLLADARRHLAEAAAEAGRRASRRAGLVETGERLEVEGRRTDADLARIREALAALPDIATLETELGSRRGEVETLRRRLAEARARHDTIKREIAARRERLAAIDTEREAWSLRIARAEAQLADLTAREVEAAAERDRLLAAPEALETRRHALEDAIAAARKERADAADRLAEAETALSACDRLLKTARERLSEAREARARADAGLENASSRRKELARESGERFSCPPPDLLARAGVEDPASLPDPADTESRLERLKAERERLGAVNLRADEELAEFEAQLTHILEERRDLESAILRLRQAIGSLNREGRERLLAAYEEVNRHFADLFKTLFGGGHATLELVESDDPLEAGLEIMASPPGKRLQQLSLLSGGEQALTALSLIFAVFMTNPAPICVLDEVDAPLDEANVERLCDLLDAMIARTETRFLIVTHNEVTMARMNRLFGVTMAERGVSQLVSVDLERAEALVAAE